VFDLDGTYPLPKWRDPSKRERCEFFHSSVPRPRPYEGEALRERDPESYPHHPKSPPELGDSLPPACRDRRPGRDNAAPFERLPHRPRVDHRRQFGGSTGRRARRSNGGCGRGDTGGWCGPPRQKRRHRRVGRRRRRRPALRLLRHRRHRAVSPADAVGVRTKPADGRLFQTPRSPPPPYSRIARAAAVRRPIASLHSAAARWRRG